VLYLDQPTTGLDPEARSAMWEEIRRLAGEDALTVVLTTHYLEEADRLADGLTIVDRGRVVAEGSPDALKATLEGDTLTVELVEPSPDLVRSVAASVTALRDVVVHVEGPTGRLVARTADGPAVVGTVIAALQAAGVRHGAVGVSRPTLDDVYLRHAGRSWTSADVAPKEVAR
jgi:ABC-2 type transport system ATP-binding protein